MSPRLIARWQARRRDAVEAVRAALADGTLAAESGADEACERIARLLHKLAGSAGMFGEAALGENAAALERALASQQPPDTREALARELLEQADGAANGQSSKAGHAAG